MIRRYSGIWAVSAETAVLFAAAVCLCGCILSNTPGGRELSMPLLTASGILEPSASESAMPLVTLKLGRGRLIAEIARTPLQAAVGLAFRSGLGSDRAMLFAYPEPHKVVFHMKDTHIPLSIAYIDSLGSILEISDLTPDAGTPVTSHSNAVRFVLEVNRGWFAANGVIPGSRVFVEQ